MYSFCVFQPTIEGKDLGMEIQMSILKHEKNKKKYNVPRNKLTTQKKCLYGPKDARTGLITRLFLK